MSRRKPSFFVRTPPKDDSRLLAAKSLAVQWLATYNASGIDNRDVLISAVGIMLAQMFVSGGANEAFAREAVSRVLTQLVVGNMPVLRRAAEEKETIQ